MIFSANDGLIVISLQRYFPSPLLSIIALIQYYTASWVGYGSGVRVAPQVPWPYLKVIVLVHMLFRVLSNVRTVVALW